MAVAIQGGRPGAAGFRAEADEARVVGDVGGEDGFAVEGCPAGDALVETQGVLADVGGEPVVDLDLEEAAVGVEDGDAAGVGVEDGEALAEDRLLGDEGIAGAADLAGDGVERGCEAIHGGECGRRRWWDQSERGT
jgi:hypothetical protein